MRLPVVVLGSLLAWFVACGGNAVTSPETGADPNATGEDAGGGSAVASEEAGAALTPDAATKVANTDVGKCVGSFGHGLTDSFGRIDGTLVAIVRPQDKSCPMVNSDHVVLEVRAQGDVYRMVVNVKSDKGTDRRVRFQELGVALPDPAFAEGWHPGLKLDYAGLGAHSTAGFEPLEMDPLIAQIVGDLHIGAPISVYATSGNGITDSAHLVHRVSGKNDGAIVVDPTSATPTFLLFHFLEQTF